jgi:enoyl-CoA hydratase
MTDELRFTVRDGIGHVVLNRPQARNPMTFAVHERSAEIAASPGDAHAPLITGAGDKAFASRTGIALFCLCYTTDDFREETQAFPDRRPPVRKGQ